VAITKHDIDSITLDTVSDGYDKDEVDVLLDRIAAEVDAFNRALLEAAARIEAAEARAQEAERQAAQSAQLAQSLKDAQPSAASEHQIAQALIAAQKSGDEIRTAARSEADKTHRESEQRARDIVRDALAEKQRIIDDAERLRASTEKFRSEYMALLGRFTAEAQKAMPALGARTPDVSKDKKAAEEAAKALREGDAAFAAPKPAAGAAPAAGADAKITPPARAAVDVDEDLDIEEID
jgi:cell division initiation protein